MGCSMVSTSRKAISPTPLQPFPPSSQHFLSPDEYCILVYISPIQHVQWTWMLEFGEAY